MPLGRSFSDFAIGDTVSFEKTFHADVVETFAALSGDHSPLHNDPEYARSSTPFGKIILPVQLAASPISAIAGMAFPGESALCLDYSVRALLPIYYDDKLVYSARIEGITSARRILLLNILVLRGRELVLQAKLTVQARTEEWATAPSWNIVKSSRKRNCLITGVDNPVGLAMAKLTAGRDWNLVLQHNSENPEEIAAECAQFSDVRLVKADLSTEEGRQHLSSLSATWDLDAIVHCASASIDAPIEQLIATNFLALGALRDATVQSMIRKQEGRFIFLGFHGNEGLPGPAANYAAAKAATQTVIDGIDRHYGNLGILAGTLAPASKDSILPEHIAHHMFRMLTEDVSTYRILEIGGATRDAAGSLPQATEPTRSSTLPSKTSSDSAKPGAAAVAVISSDRLDQVVRKALSLPPNYDLAQAGLGSTPSWDSLAHIQLVIAVEQQLGVQFTSQEIDQILSYADLKRTYEQKAKP